MASRSPNAKAALIGIPLGLAVGALALGFGQHFADTRNWNGLGIVLGLFLAFMFGMDILSRVGHKRATGTYSYSAVRTDRARRNRVH